MLGNATYLVAYLKYFNGDVMSIVKFSFAMYQKISNLDKCFLLTFYFILAIWKVENISLISDIVYNSAARLPKELAADLSLLHYWTGFIVNQNTCLPSCLLSWVLSALLTAITRCQCHKTVSFDINDLKRKYYRW